MKKKFVIGNSLSNPIGLQEKSNKYCLIVAIITITLLAVFVTTAISCIPPVYASTYRFESIIGYVYPYSNGYPVDPLVASQIPLYRYQKWDTGAYEYTTAQLYSPGSDYYFRHTFQTVAGYLAKPTKSIWTPTSAAEETVHLYLFYNSVTGDRALSTVGLTDPSFTRKGYTPFGPYIGDVFTKASGGGGRFGFPVPLYAFLIDGTHHFYSIHPYEIDALGYTKTYP